MNITPTQQAALTEAVIKEAGGDVTQIGISYATADKARRSVACDIAIDIKNSRQAPISSTLHWDGKQVDSLNKHTKIERLPILVGNRSDTKLLGAAQYLPGTTTKSGDIIAGKTIELLESWNCTKSIGSMCFDTTAFQHRTLDNSMYCHSKKAWQSFTLVCM